LKGFYSSGNFRLTVANGRAFLPQPVEKGAVNQSSSDATAVGDTLTSPFSAKIGYIWDNAFQWAGQHPQIATSYRDLDPGAQ